MLCFLRLARPLRLGFLHFWGIIGLKVRGSVFGRTQAPPLPPNHLTEYSSRLCPPPSKATSHFGARPRPDQVLPVAALRYFAATGLRGFVALALVPLAAFPGFATFGLRPFAAPIHQMSVLAHDALAEKLPQFAQVFPDQRPQSTHLVAAQCRVVLPALAQDARQRPVALAADAHLHQHFWDVG